MSEIQKIRGKIVKNELNFLNNLNRNFKLNFSVLSIVIFFEILSCESKKLTKKNMIILT